MLDRYMTPSNSSRTEPYLSNGLLSLPLKMIEPHSTATNTRSKRMSVRNGKLVYGVITSQAT